MVIELSIELYCTVIRVSHSFEINVLPLSKRLMKLAYSNESVKILVCWIGLSCERQFACIA